MKASSYSLRVGLISIAMLGLAAGPLATAREPDHFEYDPGPAPKEPGKSPSKPKEPAKPGPKVPVLKVPKGQSAIAFDAAGSRPAAAFYVPAAKPSLVQVFVEKKAFKAPVYFVRGLNKGQTIGVVVPRAWLDAGGFAPRNAADEARIQDALRRQPIRIIVE